jgi:hypothetical protein
MDGNIVVGLLWVAAISLAPLLAVYVLVRVNLIYEACMSLGRRVNLFHTPPERPVGPPIEQLVADLRRLRPEARSRKPDVPTARHKRSLAAYDTTLVATARALDVPTTLAQLHEGWERDAERFRLEHALTLTGLDWQVQER